MVVGLLVAAVACGSAAAATIPALLLDVHAAPATRMLCVRCSRTASGRLSLTVAQGLQLARSGGVVVVRTASATLRGRVKASPPIVAQ
jgi:hypothetical protein